uniref:Glycosyl hydrolase family 13 catalytic domain-containing protein n=1 Tax=Nymphaea colorata TaxID=210225 RepID=A0A5K1HLL5_9MAGN|nr:unnamed protein product [Nymphaea colorata]
MRLDIQVTTAEEATGNHQQSRLHPGHGIRCHWISPIIDNRDGGYHGYWGRNLYKLNDHFGSEQDFIDLVSACHERNILVMVDVLPTTWVTSTPTSE